METLRIYRIDDKYIHFLKSRDPRVQDNKDRRRPYVGVVLYVGSYRYFVPMESPKPNHEKIKSGRHLMKLDNGKLGLLGFNNMVPVPDSALISFDIDQEPDKQYAELLRRQVSYINKEKANVLNHASQTYYCVKKKNNEFLMRICCDFDALEKACKQYDPHHVYRKQSGRVLTNKEETHTETHTVTKKLTPKANDRKQQATTSKTGKPLCRKPLIR